MALQTLKPYIPAETKLVFRIHTASVTVAAGASDLGGGRIFSGGRLVARASGGETNGVRSGRDFKRVDMATLGNLCVDIVLNVPSLPPASKEQRKAYMDRLAASAPDKKYWEAGGNCNLAFAAARLGLCVLTLGHVGDDIYGHFLLDLLRKEGVDMVGMSEDSKTTKDAALYETLLCWVLVDPYHRHGFCSRADFSDEPAFSWLDKLSGRVEMAIQQSKILFCNGYAFDELFPDLIVSAMFCAIDAGSAVFFDAGPRGRTLFHGTPEKQRALKKFLKFSDVLLLTSDEAESLTGIKNPILAGRELIRKGIRTKWVVIKMGAKGSMLITKSSISCAPAFMVDVIDTVGCGDSFTAAIAYGFLHDMPPVNILVLGNAVGAATATGCGAGRNVATQVKVLELLRQSIIHEDQQFWSDLTDTVETEEVLLVTKSFINGRSGVLVHVPLQTVISQLIPKFETVHGNRIGCHERDRQMIEATGVDCH